MWIQDPLLLLRNDVFKAALPLSERIATASDRCSDTGPWVANHMPHFVDMHLNPSDILSEPIALDHTVHLCISGPKCPSTA